jgi:hypothetical protein
MRVHFQKKDHVTMQQPLALLGASKLSCSVAMLEVQWIALHAPAEFL